MDRFTRGKTNDTCSAARLYITFARIFGEFTCELVSSFIINGTPNDFTFMNNFTWQHSTNNVPISRVKSRQTRLCYYCSLPPSVSTELALLGRLYGGEQTSLTHYRAEDLINRSLKHSIDITLTVWTQQKRIIRIREHPIRLLL